MKKKAFISYAREDFELAGHLYDDLKKAGLDPWMDKKNLIPGQNWKQAIKAAIQKSDFFIALLSTKSVGKRGYFQKEINYAMDVLQEIPPNEIFTIPVRLDDCDVPYAALHDIHWADLFPDYQQGLESLLLAFGCSSEETESNTVEREKAESHERDKIPVSSGASGKPSVVTKDERFVVYSDETVLDTKTGLMWAMKDNGEDINWKNAKEYCETYRGGGYFDWRMPTQDELSGLFEAGMRKKMGAIYISHYWVWASETKDYKLLASDKKGSAAASVGFDNGNRHFLRQSNSNNFRALPVRASK